MQKLKGILFDFDGTLVKQNLDFELMFAAVRDTAQKYADLPKEDQGRPYILEWVENFAENLDPNTSEAFKEEVKFVLREVEVKAARASEIFPGTKECLELLKLHGLSLGVVTRNCRAAVETAFPGLVKYFTIVLARDDVELVKPNPAHLETALVKMELLPANGLMVGDHLLDLQAGKSVGMRTAGVSSGYTPAHVLALGKPDFLSANLELLTDLLVRLNFI